MICPINMSEVIINKIDILLILLKIIKINHIY